MNEKMLFEGSYFAFWDDGTFGHHDGVGFIGTAPAEEVLALYKVMQTFFTPERVQQIEQLAALQAIRRNE